MRPILAGAAVLLVGGLVSVALMYADDTPWRLSGIAGIWRRAFICLVIFAVLIEIVMRRRRR